LVATGFIGTGDPIGPIYTSTNSGVDWISNSAPITSWSAVATSADGNKMIAVADNNSQMGIYTAQTAPTPYLEITPMDDNLVFSWVVPSTNLVLQQNSDLSTTDWVTLTNAPTLNLTNLQDQVTLSPTNSSGYFRLVSQ